MKIIRYLILLLEFNVGKDSKVYSEEELAKFAQEAMLYSFVIPLITFSFAAKAKKSKNPDIIKKAERAEIVAFFLFLPILLAIIVGVGSWLFSGTWFAIVPIVIICFIIYKVKFSRKK